MLMSAAGLMKFKPFKTSWGLFRLSAGVVHHDSLLLDWDCLREETKTQTPFTPFRSPFNRLSRGKVMMLFMFCNCRQEVVLEQKPTLAAHSHIFITKKVPLTVTEETLMLLNPVISISFQSLCAVKSAPHQVFEKCRQLFGENSEISEGGADFDVVSGNTVLPELVHGLDVLLLIVHVSCNRKTDSIRLWTSHGTAPEPGTFLQFTCRFVTSSSQTTTRTDVEWFWSWMMPNKRHSLWSVRNL